MSVNIVVLDAVVHLKAFARIDGAFLVSIDVALAKAKSAALVGMSTEALGELCKPGSPGHGLERKPGLSVLPQQDAPLPLLLAGLAQQSPA